MSKILTKAALIRSLRSGTEEIDEETLLRDVPYILQAISAGPVSFSSTPAQAQTVVLTQSLTPPVLHLLSVVVEAGLLYKKVSTFASPEHRSEGLVRQSLKANFTEELTGYLNKVSVIEGEIRRQAHIDQESVKPEDAYRVTLKRVVLWINDDLLRLRLMNTIVNQIGLNEGGAIINIIHDLSAHGDPFIQGFCQKTLQGISVPFYEMLARWIYEGELVDPHYEFFVRPATMSTSSTKTGRPSSSDTSEDAWKSKYISVKVMIPRWLSDELAQKIFLIGKSLNFIRYTCGDANFVTNHHKETARVLSYGDTSAMERSIDEAYSVTSQHLKSLMLDKFHLMDHLKALKKYILLNAGDFVSVLMERLGESLEHPASTLHRHNLTSSLGDAIQTSNAQFEPDHVLRHLDARMLEGSRGTVGWEVFTLEYRLEKPVDVIFTDYNARQYLKIFNFLWRLKRVEFALSSSWRRHMTSERGMLNQVASVAADWKVARGVSDEMIHFVLQLQYYILYEVIEDSWISLQTEIASPNCDLDTIINAHSQYVKAIVDKALLGSQKRDAKDEREEDCLSLLHEILKIMLAYKDQMGQLYLYSLSEFTKVQASSGSRHRYDTTRDDSSVAAPPLPTDDNLIHIRDRLQRLAKEFKDAVSYLLAALSYQKSETMRFLAIRLNYNQFYAIPRLHRQKPSKEKDRVPSSAAVPVAS
ncbi:protein of unknown function [Taphrina deformans PYCC 5710]|uniref:Uncharacterized protein n=1 Tax=Taphrina deformans (strain PYCC 5710 / ATCC 11124 / CBS 356.35 / IMI 108563 / JCM 9778 / NBRC 8474) TaxID=1097556 RepID=R4XGR7_TAPDE|nr:protein of unknown function [Taphrina deformans PYCC 5710]|eukprot:CCG83677.1 protein of unknown function [Taphrina deformans PYCC 5710]